MLELGSKAEKLAMSIYFLLCVPIAEMPSNVFESTPFDFELAPIVSERARV
jgi:hypothetical protein